MNGNEEAEGIKVILVGHTGTGKTSLINTAMGQKFVPGTQISSMNCSFVELTKVIEDTEYTINLWDTRGQEKYRSLTKVFFKNSDIVIVVFDITSKASFDDLDYWFKEIENELGNEPIKGLAANKADLYLEQAVDDDTIKEYAQKKDVIYKYTTATTPNNFSELLIQLLTEYLEKNSKNKTKKNIGKKLEKNNEPVVKKKKCC